MESSPNTVNLIGYYGGDKRHCLSAWLSTFESLDIPVPERIEDRVDVIFSYVCQTKKKSPKQLLEMLAVEGHHTPFEKSLVDFQLHSDLATHIHALKHRISSINAESARYKELVSSFYLPDDWQKYELKVSEKSLTILQDHGIDLDSLPGFEGLWTEALTHFSIRSDILYHACLNDIAPILGRKRAKESARFFKTYNSQLHFDWQLNFRSFVNVMNLRNSSHAQREVHQITNTMLMLVEDIPGNPFEHTLKAFNLHSDPYWVL